MIYHNEFVKLFFPISGVYIYADHGYALYSAIKKIESFKLMSSNENILIFPISNTKKSDKKKYFKLTSNSCLEIICLAEYVPIFIENLNGKVLNINGDDILLKSAKNPQKLTPRSELKSELVVFNKIIDPNSFLSKAEEILSNKKFDNFEVNLWKYKNQPKYTECEYITRTRRVKKYKQVGFPITINNLSDRDSIQLQKEGLGKHTKFGCGCFK